MCYPTDGGDHDEHGDDDGDNDNDKDVEEPQPALKRIHSDATITSGSNRFS
jgi:hypothetical protein